MEKRWDAALAAGDVRIINLGRMLRRWKTLLIQNELAPGDFFRRCADQVDKESEQLDHLFKINEPPLDGYVHERMRYRQGQDRLRARITELCKIL